MKEINQKKKFTFTGAVMLFDKIVANNWSAETYAVSSKQALNNLAFRYKNSMGLLPRSQIKLTGILKEAY